VALATAGPAPAQSNWPGIDHYEWNQTLHDLGHAGAGFAVVIGCELVTDWSLKTCTGLGTVVWPVIVEIYDEIRWSGIKNDCWFECINWYDKTNDFLSYQLPWAWYFAKQKKWVSAIYTVALYGTWLYWRWWVDPKTPLRDSFWWHGAVVGGYMAGLALIAEVGPLPAYLQANIVLVFRELLQLATGGGEWTDLVSGLVLPLPYVFER
jgi:hypothetical protein